VGRGSDSLVTGSGRAHDERNVAVASTGSGGGRPPRVEGRGVASEGTNKDDGSGGVNGRSRREGDGRAVDSAKMDSIATRGMGSGGSDYKRENGQTRDGRGGAVLDDAGRLLETDVSDASASQGGGGTRNRGSRSNRNGRVVTQTADKTLEVTVEGSEKYHHADSKIEDKFRTVVNTATHPVGDSKASRDNNTNAGTPAPPQAKPAVASQSLSTASVRPNPNPAVSSASPATSATPGIGNTSSRGSGRQDRRGPGPGPGAAVPTKGHDGASQLLKEVLEVSTSNPASAPGSAALRKEGNGRVEVCRPSPLAATNAAAPAVAAAVPPASKDGHGNDQADGRPGELAANSGSRSGRDRHKRRGTGNKAPSPPASASTSVTVEHAHPEVKPENPSVSPAASAVGPHSSAGDGAVDSASSNALAKRNKSRRRGGASGIGEAVEAVSLMHLNENGDNTAEPGREKGAGRCPRYEQRSNWFYSGRC